MFTGFKFSSCLLNTNVFNLGYLDNLRILGLNWYNPHWTIFLNIKSIRFFLFCSWCRMQWGMDCFTSAHCYSRGFKSCVCNLLAFLFRKEVTIGDLHSSMSVCLSFTFFLWLKLTKRENGKEIFPPLFSRSHLIWHLSWRISGGQCIKEVKAGVGHHGTITRFLFTCVNTG